ncbi:MAG TPA: MFS transporter [Streptosporangiaceae bacterium]|nr:MFS transporter [Streptosporangiaceae bacterium]
MQPEEEQVTLAAERAEATAKTGAYRRLFATAGFRKFILTTAFQRVSIAMAPVALVLAGHAALGSFRIGALMASAYTFANAIASPLLGRLIDRMELRRAMSVQLSVAIVSLLVLAGLASSHAPALALITLSGLAGAAPAGVLGGMRAYLLRIIPGDLRERAFALDSMLLELEWMTAPALVAVTGFLGAQVLAIGLMALATLGALGGTRLLDQQPPSKRAPGMNGAWRNRQALPVYLLNAVLSYADGTINIALAPLLVVIGSRPAVAGLLITLVSATSAMGGAGYATFVARRPGNLDQRANGGLLALGLCVVLIATAPSLVVLAIATAVCGVWFAPIVGIRNVILGKLLPESQLSEGFSTLAAAGSLGYGVSGVATGIVLGLAGARACFILAAAITVTSGLVAGIGHHFSHVHHVRGALEASDSET